MRYIFLLAAIVVLLACNKKTLGIESDEPQRKQYWKKLEDYPVELKGKPVSFVLNDEIYVGLGDYNNKQFWKFNTHSGQWIRVADYPGNPRSGAISFELNGKGYAGLGEYQRIYSEPNWAGDIYYYQPGQDSWTKTTYNYFGIDGGTAFVLNDNVYHIGGGFYSNKALKKMNMDVQHIDYNVLNHQTMIESPYSSAILTGSAYIFTDYYVPKYSYNEFNSVYKFDPITKTMEYKSKLPDMVLFRGCAFTLNSSIYFGAGYSMASDKFNMSRESPNKKFFQYDIFTNSWEFAFDYPGESIENLVAAEVNGKLYIGLGTGSPEFWYYDPVGF